MLCMLWQAICRMSHQYGFSSTNTLLDNTVQPCM